MARIERSYKFDDCSFHTTRFTKNRYLDDFSPCLRNIRFFALLCNANSIGAQSRLSDFTKFAKFAIFRYLDDFLARLAKLTIFCTSL